MSNKARVMMVLKYLQENTNEDHIVNSESIISYLEANDIKADRKTIYNDIKTLNEMDFAVEKKSVGYYYDGEIFELAELRILIDEIKTNSFLSKKKTETIIQKLLSLTNRYDREVVSTSYKSNNRTNKETIYYDIDTIIKAINTKNAIRFKYFDLDLSKNKVFRRNKNNYIVYPYELVINNNRYYLICGNPKHPEPTVFRLDKMESVGVEEKIFFDKIPNLSEFLLKTFSMFTGETEDVTLRCHKRFFEEVEGKFDKLTIVTATNSGNGDEFECHVKVNVSPTFYSWVFTFGGQIKILGPEKVKNEFAAMCKNMAKLHK